MKANRRKLPLAKGWEPLRPATYALKTPEQIEDMVADLMARFPHLDEAHVRDTIDRSMGELGTVWKNWLYTVHVIRWKGQGPKGVDIVQLSVKRNDRAPVRDWRHCQRIKNQLVGRECEGVELYPAESRLVDTANQYHIFCVDDPTYRWPIGYTTERMVTSDSFGGAIQRPQEEIDK